MYYLLNEKFLLKSQLNQFRKLIDKETKVDVEISKQFFDLLKKCNGRHNLKSNPSILRLENKGIIREIKKPIKNRIERITEGNIFLKRSISTAFLCITGRCNMKCKHCYFLSHREDSELKTIQIKRIIDKIHAAGIYTLCITGGEPLLRDDLEEICSYLSKKEMLFKINTNGSLLNKKRIESLIKTGLAKFQISLDTISRRNFSFRGFDHLAILKNIKTVARYRRKGKIKFLAISTMLTKNNVFELKKMYKILTNSIKPDEWYMEKPLACGNYRDFAKEYDIKIRMLEPYLHELIKKVIREKPDYPYRIFFDKYYDWANSKYIKITKKIAYSSKKDFACNGHFNHLYIMPNGEVTICFHTDVFPFYAGNIKNESLRKIWDKLEDFKSEFRLSKLECAKCNFLKICGGGCRVVALLNTGNLKGCDTDCREYIERGFKLKL